MQVSRPCKCPDYRVSSFQWWICTIKHTLGHLKFPKKSGVLISGGGLEGLHATYKKTPDNLLKGYILTVTV